MVGQPNPSKKLPPHENTSQGASAQEKASRRFRFGPFSLRFELGVGFLAVLLLVNIGFSLAMVIHLGHAWLREVQTRVRLDLNSAREAYNNRLGLLAAYLAGAGTGQSVLESIRGEDRHRLVQWVERRFDTKWLEFLVLTDHQGRVLARATRPEAFGDDLSANPLIRHVLSSSKALAGTIVLSREELLSESETLAERARFELIPTPAAKPTEDKQRTDGLVLAAAVPVINEQGELRGVLYGGKLVNRDYELVDAIKNEVFFGERWRGKDLGTVTIFLGDLRIATNVLQQDGTRAVGTRLSAPVVERVLEQGGVWAAPAFVVNEWYITAYEPIRDIEGKIVGVLYVGLLQAPFVQRRNLVAGVFLGAVLVTTLLSLILLSFVSRLVLQPIDRIVSMAQKVIGGDLTVRVGIRPPGELGVLCDAIDRMADAVAEREQQLALAARKQLTRSEQLASIGRLAAGVAHEINNPLTGVLTFAHLLREKENMDEQDRQDLDLIIHETTRAAEIVRGLLDFARERPSVKQPLALNEVIRRTVKLLGNQRAFHNINVVEDLAEDLPLIHGDQNQLQQVVLNLMINACEAMPRGGTLLVQTTRTPSGDKVILKVGDTGVGISPEHLEKIFEPFFSTKPVGKGTGLGLSVTYGIVQQHGGTIEVESTVGKGSVFTITFPSVEKAMEVAAVQQSSGEGAK